MAEFLAADSKADRVDPLLDDPEPGAMMGPYRIVELIGQGGMGAVYRAEHTMIQRTVALKILAPELAQDPEFLERFKREAQVLAQLKHPNIVALYDLGAQDGRYYLAMEYVHGANLRSVLKTGKLTPAQALALVPKLCDALEYAHGQGVVHRDIKPENILLDASGEPKIADFGLARIVRGDRDSGRLTQTRHVMGTPVYMAPEQYDDPKGVDHRADIYALGVVLYEMLTGEQPVGSWEPPSRKSGVDMRLDDVVAKAMARKPDRRYQSAGQMERDVTQVRETPYTDSRPRTSRMAVTSLALAIVVIADFAFGPKLQDWFLPAAKVLFLISALGSIVFGIASLFAIARSKGRLKGTGYAIGGLAMTILPWLLILCFTRTSPVTDETHPPATITQDTGLEKKIEQLDDDDPKTRQAATMELVKLGPKAKEALQRAAKNGTVEVVHRSMWILDQIELVENLKSWGEDSVATWSVIWDLRAKDLERLKLLCEIAGLKDVEKKYDAAQQTLKTLMNDWKEMWRSDEEKQRYDAIKKQVCDRGVTIVPGLCRILEADMNAAFAQMRDGKPFVSVYDSPITQRDQVKALYAVAWLKRRETLPLVAKHLKSLSRTAASCAVGAIQVITGKTVVDGNKFLLNDDEIERTFKWWTENRERYMKKLEK